MIYLDYNVLGIDPEIGKPDFVQPLSLFSRGMDDFQHELFAVSTTTNQLRWRRGHKRKWDWAHYFGGHSQNIWCSPAILVYPFSYFAREDINHQRNYGLRRRTQVLC